MNSVKIDIYHAVVVLADRSAITAIAELLVVSDDDDDDDGCFV